MMSIQSRLLIAASLILAVFFGATGMILEQAFYHGLRSDVEQRLPSHLYTVLAVADHHRGQEFFGKFGA